MITNNAKLNVSMAAWLAADTYDYDPNAISATALLKPIKSIVLASRVNNLVKVPADIQDFTKSRTGTSVHDSIEAIWKDPILLEKTLRKLEETAHLFKNDETLDDVVDINPVTPSTKPLVVHLEQRVYRDLGEHRVSGKYDFILNGTVEDHKTTSTYTYTKGLKAEEYILQGSIYRWLNPDIITNTELHINFLFTDWKKGEAARNPKYPQSPAITVSFPLMTIEDTEDWIRNRIQTVHSLQNKPEEQMPDCTKIELWQDDSVFKYYADPTKTVKSTKNFKDAASAYEHKALKGKGIVMEIQGKATFCNFCSAAPICKQYQSLVENGLAGE